MPVEKNSGQQQTFIKGMPSSYQVESKTFIEASCTNTMNSGEKVSCSCSFEALRDFYFETE